MFNAEAAQKEVWLIHLIKLFLTCVGSAACYIVQYTIAIAMGVIALFSYLWFVWVVAFLIAGVLRCYFI